MDNVFVVFQIRLNRNMHVSFRIIFSNYHNFSHCNYLLIVNFNILQRTTSQAIYVQLNTSTTAATDVSVGMIVWPLVVQKYFVNHEILYKSRFYS